MTSPSDNFRDWDAAYVLGALDSTDRRAFEAHLETCPECSASVAEMAGLPGILGKLSADDAVALLVENDPLVGIDDHLRDAAHTPGVVQRLAVAARRRRRRNRIALIGAAFGVVAILGVGGIVYTANQTPAASTVAMAAIHQHVVEARMTITPQAWGTRFDWSCTYNDADDKWSASTSYDLVVTLKSGAEQTVASWSSTAGHAAGLTASADIPTGDIQSVEIRLSGSTKPLLRETL